MAKRSTAQPKATDEEIDQQCEVAACTAMESIATLLKHLPQTMASYHLRSIFTASASALCDILKKAKERDKKADPIYHQLIAGGLSSCAVDIANALLSFAQKKPDELAGMLEGLSEWPAIVSLDPSHDIRKVIKNPDGVAAKRYAPILRFLGKSTWLCPTASKAQSIFHQLAKDVVEIIMPLSGRAQLYRLRGLPWFLDFSNGSKVFILESTSPGAAAKLTPDALRAFVAANYTAPRIVLAGAGIAHAELSGLGSPLLAAALPPGAPRPAAPASAYVGGDFRQYAASGLTHTMLAFEAPGGWRAVEAAVALTVAQFLLGGGGSFSAGGPGKGMHSRLYTRVLNRHAWVHNCTAFSSLYNDTGLVGVFATAESAKAAESVSVVAAELAALAAAPVPAADLDRAKAAAVSSVLMNLESRAVVAEDIGRQALTYGHRKPVAEFVGAIRGLTPGALQAAVKACLATPLSMATLGDIAAVPRYDAVAAKFK